MLESRFSRVFSAGFVKRYSSSSHNYQKTLNLPRTKFPVRSNIQKSYNHLIPQSSQVVYKNQLEEFFIKYNEISNQSEFQRLEFIKNNLFILHDGPPYANGDLHLGHALNKILKDIINRYHLSQGKHIYYQPGWDCHGLPIELKALKKLTNDQIEHISPIKIRNIAGKHAKTAQLRQKNQFEKFGILTDWNNPYITMDKQYQIDQLNIFKKLFVSGLIKRQNKPVFWGTETRTALAEGELEYNENHKSVSAYVYFPLTTQSVSDLTKKLNIKDIDSIDCLIWTSTPWTLFSNQAICYNENFNYSLVRLEKSKKNIIISSELISNLKISEEHTILTSFDGSYLQDLKYENPLLSKDSTTDYPLINAYHVTNAAGTGLVHTAPGHGPDDYLVGLQNSLPIFSPIDHKGNYDLAKFSKSKSAQEFLKDPNSSTNEGRNVLDPKTTTAIIEKLTQLGMLLDTEVITHSYPYDWRSKKPIIIRSTPQWFTNLENLKKLSVESLNKVQFHPQRGKHRLVSFVKNRNEWCISRQRSWGVPIPYFQHRENPDSILMDEEIISIAIKNIEKWGIDSWFLEEDLTNEKTNIKNWLPSKYYDVASEYKKGRDTMDVWFDSGSSWSTTKNFYRQKLAISEEYLPNPLANVYLEGSDQHRGWFQSSLLCKVAYSESSNAPYGIVITHGFTLDEKGIKMSKSIGNTISPIDIIEGNKNLNLPSLGVDGLRYLIAQSDFTSDITAGPTVMKHASDALKKIRLCFKFLLGNLQESSDFKLLPFNELARVDKYAISKLQTLITSTTKYYSEYNFAKILIILQHHLNNDLSAFYFNISKDTLYSNSVSSLRRGQIQTTLYHILDTYRAILSPILPLLVQEVWNYIPKQWLEQNITHTDSPSTKPWPNYEKDIEVSRDILKSFEENEIKILVGFKDQFKKIIQTNNTITKTSQTTTILYITSDLRINADDLTEILQTANVEIKKVNDIGNLTESVTQIAGINSAVLVKPSTMKKCPRCWKHNSVEEDTLCGRCEQETLHIYKEKAL